MSDPTPRPERPNDDERRCKKCDAVLPPWNGRDGIIQCEKCGTLHGAPPPLN